MIGLHEAIILSEIINKYDYFFEKGQLTSIADEDDWFYITMEYIQDRTTLTERQQRPAINNLIKRGLIKTKTYGQPSKRYFHIERGAFAALLALDEKRDKLISNNVCRDDILLPLGITKCNPYRSHFVTPIYKEKENKDKRTNIREDIVSHKSPPSSRTMQAARRYKLSAEQEGVLGWLKEQIPDTDEKTLCYWAKTYDLKRLNDVMHAAKDNNATNLGAYMHKLLKSEIVIHDANAKDCAEFAKDFKLANGWDDLEIGRKYVTFWIGKSKEELSLSGDPVEFAKTLMNKYKSIRGFQ